MAITLRPIYMTEEKNVLFDSAVHDIPNGSQV